MLDKMKTFLEVLFHDAQRYPMLKDTFQTQAFGMVEFALYLMPDQREAIKQVWAEYQEKFSNPLDFLP